MATEISRRFAVAPTTEITEISEVLVLQTKVSHMIRSGRYEKSNLLSRNYFAVIDSSLKKSISRQAQRILELQDQDEKRVVPPTTGRYDVICPIKTMSPPLRLCHRLGL